MIQPVERLPIPVDMAQALRNASDGELLELLSAADFLQREAATEELRGRGEGVFPLLEECYRTTGDHEVRLRIQDIVRHIYSDAHLTENTGFLGIRQRLATGALNPLGGDGHTAVMIDAVLPGTAAAASGLQAGDLIIAVDGKEIPADMNAFRDLIRSNAPGTPMTFQVLRGRLTLNFEIRIGHRAAEFAEPDRVLKVSAEFERFWAEHFALPSNHIGRFPPMIPFAEDPDAAP